MRLQEATYPPTPSRHWLQGIPREHLNQRLVQRTFFFVALHLPLGFAIKASPWIATAHALGTALVALAVVADSRSMSRVLPVFGYVAASESLWRVGQAMVFYEMSKYLLSLLALLAFARFGNPRRASKTPLIYFALLLPSILVLPEFDRSEVSFNLSGPFCLAVVTLFFSQVRLSAEDLRRILTTAIGPIVAIATVATFSTVTTDNIDFYRSKVTSAGLGQNQASSLLGLGALIAFLYLGMLRRERRLSHLFGALGLWCAGQAALTFSRGGLATTIGAAAAATFFLSLDRRFRGAAVLRVVLVLILAVALVVPLLTSLTEGQVKDRFTSSSLTGRDKIIEADILTFLEHPLFGVGPGQSYEYHARTFKASNAHTEYSRLLSEHGMFGVMALLLLFRMSWHHVFRNPAITGKALSAALITWSLLFMFHAAMRMAVVSFIFGLGAAIFVGPASRVTPPRVFDAGQPKGR